MKFWDINRFQLEHLYKYAVRHRVGPGTSVASESAFITASYLLRKQQSRLTPENLSSVMFVKDRLNDNFNISKK